MGLDQYAWAVPADYDYAKDGSPTTDASYPDCFRNDEVFGNLFVVRQDCRALAYWRKHPNLHGLIHEIAKGKPGYDAEKMEHWGSLAGHVALDSADIDRIEQATKEKTLPHTEGFFFGKSLPGDDALTLEFCKRAREAIADGLTVIYDSSW